MNMIKKQKSQRSLESNPANPVSRSQSLVSPLLSWFSAHARDLPWRRTHDPYAIWVSEIMLQQTQVKTVIPYWERWLRELPTIKTLAQAHPDKIHKLWEGLGYYTRVRSMQKAAQQIVALSCSRRREEAETAGKSKSSASSPRRLREYEFPQTFDTVLALPGIGRYTAGAICSIAFNQPTPILDGNVIRVLTRLFGIATDPRERQTNAQLWQLAEELVTHAARLHSPRSSRRKEAHTESRNSQSLLTLAATSENACSHLNQSLMELGALICTPRSPNCSACPVKKPCIARKENLQDQLPNLAKREAATARRFLAFVVEHKGQFLVRQRPDGMVNAHLWEFPNAEVGARVCDPQHSVAKELGLKVTAPKPIRTIKHSITRYRITLEAWHAELADPNGAPASDPARRNSTNTPGRKPALQGEWRTVAQLRKLAFTSAHKNILTQIEAKTGHTTAKHTTIREP